MGRRVYENDEFTMEDSIISHDMIIKNYLTITAEFKKPVSKIKSEV